MIFNSQNPDKPKYLSTLKWIMIYSHMKYYTAMRMNKLQLQTTPQTTLKITTLKERKHHK